MNFFIELFRKPSSEQLAQRELEEARRQLLVAQSNAEYTNALVNYHKSRIHRLEAVLREVL